MLSQSLIFANLIGKLLYHFSFPYHLEHIFICLMAISFLFSVKYPFFVLCLLCALLRVLMDLMDILD